MKETLSVTVSRIYSFTERHSQALEYDYYPEVDSGWYERSLKEGVLKILTEAGWTAPELYDTFMRSTSEKVMYNLGLYWILSALDHRVPKHLIGFWLCGACAEPVIEGMDSDQLSDLLNVSDGQVHECEILK